MLILLQLALFLVSLHWICHQLLPLGNRTSFIHWSSSVRAHWSDRLSFGLHFETWKDVSRANPFPQKQLFRNYNEGWIRGTNYLDASRAAFTHCVRHSGTRRINHGDEAQEAELLGGEVRVVAVEGESSRELRCRHIQVAEACKSRGISEVIIHKWHLGVYTAVRQFFMTLRMFNVPKHPINNEDDLV